MKLAIVGIVLFAGTVYALQRLKRDYKAYILGQGQSITPIPTTKEEIFSLGETSIY